MELHEAVVELESAEAAHRATGERLLASAELVRRLVSRGAREAIHPAEATGGDRWIAVTDWPKHHPWPSVRGLRHLISQAPGNGFDRVVRHVGSRVVVSEAAFREWMSARGEDTTAPAPAPSTRRTGRPRNTV